MHTIPLRSMADETGTIESAELVRTVIRRPLAGPQQGADIDEIRRGIRVFDALDKANGSLELEDADWEHLRDKTKAMQWGIVDRRILTFVDDVLGAELG